MGKKFGGQGGIEMRGQHVDVGPLIHKLAEADLGGKFLADGEGDLRQRERVESLLHEGGGSADLRAFPTGDWHEQVEHTRGDAILSGRWNGRRTS